MKTNTNNHFISPKFSEKKISNDINANKLNDYKITHLDLNVINNKINNYKDNIHKNYYDNLQLIQAIPSFSIINNNKCKNYKINKHGELITENERIKNNQKRSHNKKLKYINNTDKLINTTYQKQINSNNKDYLNYEKMIKTNKDKDKNFKSYFSNKIHKFNSLNKTHNKNNKNNNLTISKNLLADKEDISPYNNSLIKKDKEINYNRNNRNEKCLQNNNENDVKTTTSFEKYIFENKNKSNKKNIDQNLKQKIQDILGKNINFILFKNLLNQKIKNNNTHNYTEKSYSIKNEKKRNNILTNINSINNNYSFNCNIKSNINNSNTNDKKNISAGHNKKVKPTCLIKVNKNNKNINSKNIFGNISLRKNKQNKNINYNKISNKSFTNKTKKYTLKKDLLLINSFKPNNNITFANYNTNPHKNVNKHKNKDISINLNKLFTSKAKKEYNLEKIYIIDNKDINIFNVDDNYDKTINNNNDACENMKDKKKDGYNSIGLSLEIDGHNNNDNRINNINNNIDNSLLMNNTINKNKKSLAFIKDFSKYKRKIV